jgi:DNA-binding response OmpR family regulator
VVAKELPATKLDLTVLVVDDHPSMRKAVRRILSAMGLIQVIECFDGDSALKITRERSVDLMILDLYMNGVSGFDVLERIKKSDVARDLPVIVVTGESGKDEIVKVVGAGAEDYLVKPFQANELERKVTKVINRFHAPTPFMNKLQCGERLYAAGQFEKALANFENALQIEPLSASAALGRALTLNKLGQSAEALKTLSLSLRSNPNYHRSYGAAADILLEQGRTAEAIVAMERELTIHPKQLNRQVQLACLLQEAGRPQASIVHFRKSLQENHRNFRALLGMAYAQAAVNNIDKAFYYLKRAKRHHPNRSEVLEAVVRLSIAAGVPRKAELFLRDERRSNPHSLEITVILADFYKKQHRDDEAMTLAREVLAREPTNPKAMRLCNAQLLAK